MEITKCKLCGRVFDHLDRKPLVLPKCGHTFCQECIYSRVNNDRFSCPSDLTDYDAQGGVFDFPVNNLIENRLEKSDAAICHLHEKTNEYFCVNDCEEVCANCALFGEHKNHTLVPNKEVQSINDNLIAQICSSIKEFKFQADYASFDRLDALVIERIHESFRKARKSFTKQYEDLRRKLKNHIFGSLNENERKFVEKIDPGQIDPSGFYPGFKQSLWDSKEIVEALEKKNSRSGEHYTAIYRELQDALEKVRDSSRQYKFLEEYFDLAGNLEIELEIDEEKFLEAVKPKIVSKSAVLKKGVSSHDNDESLVLYEPLEGKGQLPQNIDTESDANSETSKPIIRAPTRPKLEFASNRERRTVQSLSRNEKKMHSPSHAEYLINSLTKYESRHHSPSKQESNMSPFARAEALALASIRASRHLVSPIKLEDSANSPPNSRKLTRSIPDALLLTKKSYIGTLPKDMGKSSSFMNSSLRRSLTSEDGIHFLGRQSLMPGESSPHELNLKTANSSGVKKTSLGLRNSSQTSNKNTPKKNPISFNQKDGVWTFSNHQISKEKLEELLFEIQSAGKKVQRVNLTNNKFECDPVGVIKDYVKKPLSGLVTIDLRKSAYFAGVKKDAIPKLILYNFKIIL